MGSAITNRPTAHGMAMRPIVRTADSSVFFAKAVFPAVSAAVIAGMTEMVMVGMNAHGSAKIVCWKE